MEYIKTGHRKIKNSTKKINNFASKKKFKELKKVMLKIGHGHEHVSNIKNAVILSLIKRFRHRSVSNRS